MCTGSLRILYLLFREGAEWILSSRPCRGGQGPRRDGGGSDAEADRPGRLRSVFFLNCRMRGTEVVWGRRGSSAEGARQPLEPGREAPRRVRRSSLGRRPRRVQIWVYCTLGHREMCQIMRFFEHKLIRV